MSTINKIEGAGSTGGPITEVIGYDRIIYHDQLIPYEPSRLYRVRARVKNTVRPADTARNKIRVGVEGIASDGETMVDAIGGDSIGSQFFVAADLVDMQALTLDTWYEFTGYILGQGTYVPNATDPATPSPLSVGVAYVRPVVWVGCTDGDGTYQIDTVFLDNMADGDDIITRLGTAADVVTVAGVPADVVGSGAGVNYAEDFERPVAGRYTFISGAGAPITYPIHGYAGGKVIEITGACAIEFMQNIPVDPSRLYRATARIRCTDLSTNVFQNAVTIGLTGIEQNGTGKLDFAGQNNAGGQRVLCWREDFQNKTLNTWYEFTGYFKGIGADTADTPSRDPVKPKNLYAGTCYMRPYLAVGQNNGFTPNGDPIDGVIEIDYYRIEVCDLDATALQLANTDTLLMENQSYAGRTGSFELGSTFTPAFGKIVGLWPLDGLMYPANIYDSNSNGFMAVCLGSATGRVKLALPGTVLRDDTLSLMEGREIFLHPTTAGAFTQTEPTAEQMRCIVGHAITATSWIFNPQPYVLVRETTPMSARFIHQFVETFSSLIEWSGYIYAGCSNGKVYRTNDGGKNWTNVYTATGGTGASVNGFAVMGSSLFAVVDRGTDSYSKCIRTTNGTTWYSSNVSTDKLLTDIMKKVASNLLIASTGAIAGETYAKIYTSPDGVTWTLRYTSTTEDTIIRLAGYGVNTDYALAGYAGAKTFYSINGTTWAVRNTYTGYYVPGDILNYTPPETGTSIVLALVSDAGRIYSGTTTIATIEKEDANIWWDGLFVVDGVMYAHGTVTGSYQGQIWKRKLTWDGVSSWTVSWVKVLEASNLVVWRALAAADGFAYFASFLDDGFYRIAKRCFITI